MYMKPRCQSIGTRVEIPSRRDRGAEVPHSHSKGFPRDYFVEGGFHLEDRILYRAILSQTFSV